MNNQTDERDIYYIPPNFLTSGRLFGGMIRVRNAIEACALVFLTGLPIIKLPLTLTARIILLCLVTLPLAIFAIIGFDGDSLSEFAVNWLKWLMNRRILYRAGSVPPEEPDMHPRSKLPSAVDHQPPEQLGIALRKPGDLEWYVKHYSGRNLPLKAGAILLVDAARKMAS